MQFNILFIKLKQKKGATYDISAHSFEDPSVLVYDNQGKAILVNDDSDNPDYPDNSALEPIVFFLESDDPVQGLVKLAEFG